MSGFQVAFRYLVDNLREVKNVRSVRVLDEGAMIVTVAQATFEEEIVVYLLAGELSVGFIKKTLNANTDRDMHTLYILAHDLITDDGQVALMSDALRLILHAHGGKVYVFRTEASSVSIFPLFIGADRRITYGEQVNLRQIGGDYATFNNKYLLGVRKIAGFDAQPFHGHPPAPAPNDPLYACFTLLGISSSASLDEVKRAYRHKARQHHPDTDKSPGATARMQEINDAYARILARYE
ncbi:MAG: DnaJ domain-containing protein [Anaerolineae bacterium]|nr:DnaJ domain-containing protein [Anaerolineae bacterium]